MKNQIIPSRRFRWCTDKFKIRPIMKYIETPCDIYIGFDAGEEKRISTFLSRKFKKGFKYAYPLIESELYREDCINLIRSHGLDIPQKSGCWFCPFMRVAEIRDLYTNQLKLFNAAIKLENNCRRKDLFIKEKSLLEYIKHSVLYLTSFNIRLL